MELTQDQNRSSTWLRFSIAGFGCSVLCARIAAGPVSVRDLAMELSAFAVLGLVAQLGHKGFLAGPISRAATGAVGVSVGGAAIFSVLHFGFSAELGTAAPISAAISFGGWGVMSGVLWLSRPAWIAPAFVVTLVMTYVAGWSLREALAPDLGPWFAMGALMVLGVPLAFKNAGVVLFALVAAIMALVPGEARPAPPAAWTGTGPANAGPDVVLIVADTLRADTSQTLSVHGRLARMGSDLSPAHAASTWTLPSTASLLTGQPVAVHGAGRQRDGSTTALRSDVPTLAERLAQAGYDTAAVLAANPFVSDTFGLARGFQVYDYHGSHSRGFDPFPGTPGVGYPAVTYLLHRIAYRLSWQPLARLLHPLSPNDNAAAVTQRALQLLKTRRRDRPLFLWLQLMDVHAPYTDAYELALPPNGYSRLMTKQEHGSDELGCCYGDGATQALFRRAYTHQAGHMDRALNRFIDELGPPPQRGRLLILTSDHGEEFWEHGAFGHGHAFWQGVTAVPLVIAGLRAAPRSVSEPASQLDVVPTVLHAAGLSTDGLPGTDATEPLDSRRVIVTNLLYKSEQTHAVRQGALKLIAGGGGNLLFDLERDPAERENVCERRPRECANLDRDGGAVDRQGESVKIPAAKLEALRSLGYIR